MSNIETLRAELAAVEAEWAAKIGAAKDLRKIDAVVNEAAEGYSLSESAQERIAAEYLPKVSALRAAVFAADWTLDVTVARRAAWNASVQAMVAQRLPMTAKSMAALIAKHGHTLDDLRRAVALHKLP